MDRPDLPAPISAPLRTLHIEQLAHRAESACDTLDLALRHLGPSLADMPEVHRLEDAMLAARAATAELWTVLRGRA